jgi:CcmD family protein
MEGSALLVSEGVALYVVLAVALVVWLGLFAYLWFLDRRLRRLEREVRPGRRTDG